MSEKSFRKDWWNAILKNAWVTAIVFVMTSTSSINSLSGGEDIPLVDFQNQILPILKRDCWECHGPLLQSGGLRFDLSHSISSSGVIEPGDAEKSELLRRLLLPDSHPEAMPPSGDRITPNEVTYVKLWIEQGARLPDSIQIPKHWAYVPPKRSESPKVKNTEWGRNAIDAFVLRKLEDRHLVPAAEAVPHILVRRLFLDIIGLPPSPEEIKRFTDHPNEVNYLALVDELLSRPQFGEKWARPWLDAARYADSHGFQRDDLVEIWAFRDWVIQALNTDMPFDQFTIEQLAGDLLPGATESQRIATGFHQCAPINVEAGAIPEETRHLQVVDRVNTTVSVWLATTLECAQCHDHKFDPITQEEYFQLFAYFNSTRQEAFRTKPSIASSIAFQGSYLSLGDADRKEQHRLAESELEEQKMKLAELSKSLRRDIPFPVADDLASELVGESLPHSLLEIIAKSKESWTEKDIDIWVDYRLSQDTEGVHLKSRIESLQDEVARLQPHSTLVMIEERHTRATTILEGGDYRRIGKEVQSASPVALFPEGIQSGGDRLELARWIANDQNPLTSRVIVNRWWSEIFGQGIVTTVEDFGVKGEAPSHPELLDWLAIELIENHWSMKRVLRQIFMSSTYRQASSSLEHVQGVDDTNKLLARGASFRMDAEMIRDNTLSIAGLLNLKPFGRPIRPWQPDGIWSKVGGQSYEYIPSPAGERHRRGVYVVSKRGSPYPSFSTFDAPGGSACTLKRSRSNTPLQALTLLNDPTNTEAAFSLAERILDEAPSTSPEERIRYGFLLATARHPSKEELHVLTSLYNDQTAAFSRRRLDAETLVGAYHMRNSATDPCQLAVWYSIALTLLNLHETVTKR